MRRSVIPISMNSKFQRPIFHRLVVKPTWKDRISVLITMKMEIGGFMASPFAVIFFRTLCS